MAEPAHASVDGAEPAGRKPDPRASGWAAAQRAMATAAQSCALAVAELAARPGDGAALEMARLTLAVLENLGGTLRDLSYGEELLKGERERAYAQGVADCKAARCRLQVVDGG
jgi:hypothetical protein